MSNSEAEPHTGALEKVKEVSVPVRVRICLPVAASKSVMLAFVELTESRRSPLQYFIYLENRI